MNIVEKTITLYDNIAAKNNDKFRYKVEIENSSKGLIYNFIIEETEEGHCITNGFGNSIESAAQKCFNDVKNACEGWGYKYIGVFKDFMKIYSGE